jgi:hypothetical protein
LIRFLREEICERHDRQLFFRTWDTLPDKLHARLDHYLEVTSQIKPHPKLAFSIKHTALDFWRRVKANPCLAQGWHPQIIEVQCQREYEGKGAFPNYIMNGVLNGFPENTHRVGLKQWLAHPFVLGVYSWSRGGGWYGPYLKDEFWCDLNAFVLARFAAQPDRTEQEIFHEHATVRMGLSEDDALKFRELCLLSSEAVLKGRHCEVFDRELNESLLPTSLWMRDDRLGGRYQLSHVLSYLERHKHHAAALSEKAEAVLLWERMKQLAQGIRWPDAERGRHVCVSVEYGRLLFSLIYHGWRVLLCGHHGDATGDYDTRAISDAAKAYDRCWEQLRKLGEESECASLFEGNYFNLPGAPSVPGLDETVAHYLAKSNAPAATVTLKIPRKTRPAIHL